MIDAALEELVAAYLAHKEREPVLTPEKFAAEFPTRREELIEILHGLNDVLDLFPEEPPEPGPPGSIGPYRIVREIGRGGMGVVYEVTRDGARFALKLLPMAPLLGERAMGRFEREREALHRLEHPNIVRIVDSGFDDRVPYLVMELVEGVSLGDLAGGLAWRDAVELVRALAVAVQSAHDAGVIHRDVKPQNVIVRDDASPVLLDFGLIAAEDVESLTSTGDLLGTPRYMAPEQVEGRAAGPCTDIHALGLILYELTTGEPARRQESRERVLQAVRAGAFARPRRRNAEIPAELEKILLTALALNPQRRFASAAALAEDLQRLVDGVPVSASPPGALVRMGEKCRRSPAKAAAVGLSILLGILVLWTLVDRPAGVTSEERARLERFLEQGIEAWLDGEWPGSQVALERVLEIDAGNDTARLLLAWMAVDSAAAIGEGDGDVEGRSVFSSEDESHRFEPGSAARLLDDGFRHFEKGAFTAALTAFQQAAAIDREFPLVPILVGGSAMELGRFELAERELIAARGRFPGSHRIAEDLGFVFMELGKGSEAVKELRHVIDIRPEATRPWKLLAKTYERMGDVEAGLEAVGSAMTLSSENDPEMLTIYATLLDKQGERRKARKILRGLLEEDGDNADARFRLGISLDYDHLIVEAEQAYREVLALRPRSVTAIICLANLYSGADRGRCRGCDLAYAEHPEFLDLKRAERYLLDALEISRGRHESVNSSALDIALRLEDRRRVVGLLERLTARNDEEKSKAVLQLERLLRRLRVAEGE